MPIVIAASLAFWISIVLYALSHPKWKHHGVPPRSEVAGGSFMALDGGRQLEPIPERPAHEIPAQRAPAAAETYETADLESTRETGATGATSSVGEEGSLPQAGLRHNEEARAAGIGLPPA
jgi:hypothetical protein